MIKSESKEKPNLLIELAKRKAAAQASGGSKIGILGKDLSSQFKARGGHMPTYTKRGGRNGSGKP